MSSQSNTRAIQQVTYSDPLEFQKFLEKAKGKIAMALPKHLNPDRMLRLALTSFSSTPKLRECSGMSILSSIIIASQLGLEPGVAGQGYLIPYGSTCTFVPGWQGLVGLLNNSGRATAWTNMVFEGDVWDFQLGSEPRCIHIPGDNYGDPEKMKWVYACGKVNGSQQPVIEAWPMSRVWKHRDRFNKVGSKHYSYTHPEMYARKVVLLQVLKYMPRSVELQNALTVANASEMGRVSLIGAGSGLPADDALGAGAVITEGPEIEGEKQKLEFTPEDTDARPKNETNHQAIARLLKENGIEFSTLRGFLRRAEEGDFKAIEEISDRVAGGIVASWENILPNLK